MDATLLYYMVHGSDAEKVKVADLVEAFAGGDESKIPLVEAEVVIPLIETLIIGTKEQRQCAIRLIAVLALNKRNKTAFVQAGVIPRLVKLVQSEDDEDKKISSEVVRNLVICDEHEKERLLGLLDSTLRPEDQSATIRKLSENFENRSFLIQAGFVPQLIDVLYSGPEDAKPNAADAIRNLVVADISDKNHLVEQLEKKGEFSGEDCCWRIAKNLFGNIQNHAFLFEAGVRPPPLEVVMKEKGRKAKSRQGHGIMFVGLVALLGFFWGCPLMDFLAVHNVIVFDVSSFCPSSNVDVPVAEVVALAAEVSADLAKLRYPVALSFYRAKEAIDVLQVAIMGDGEFAYSEDLLYSMELFSLQSRKLVEQLNIVPSNVLEFVDGLIRDCRSFQNSLRNLANIEGIRGVLNGGIAEMDKDTLNLLIFFENITLERGKAADLRIVCNHAAQTFISVDLDHKEPLVSLWKNYQSSINEEEFSLNLETLNRLTSLFDEAGKDLSELVKCLKRFRDALKQPQNGVQSVTDQLRLIKNSIESLQSSRMAIKRRNSQEVLPQTP